MIDCIILLFIMHYLTLIIYQLMLATSTQLFASTLVGRFLEYMFLSWENFIFEMPLDR